jgi:hypothetical protein
LQGVFDDGLSNRRQGVVVAWVVQAVEDRLVRQFGEFVEVGGEQVARLDVNGRRA